MGGAWRGEDSAGFHMHDEALSRAVADLTSPLRLGFQYDAVLSLEVAEHIPAGAPEAAFVANLDRHCRRLLVVSWGNQGGHGHVNNRESEYVVQRFENIAGAGRYMIDWVATWRLRDAASFAWFKETLHVFRRTRKLAAEIVLEV